MSQRRSSCRLLQLAVAGMGALFLCSAPTFAQQAPQKQQSKGVPARATPADYQAHVEVDGVSYAAALVSPDQVKHIFAFDITKTYVVFEVAVYPARGAVMIDPESFVVRLAHSADYVHPADSVTVASVIQQKNLPPQHQKTGVIVASTEVGYESGRDPYTGRPVHGTYTASQVGVSTGPDGGPPPMPSPGGYPQDRELLEDQLWARGMPEGTVQHATAGYLYFPASLLKKKSGDSYELDYLSSGRDEPAPLATTSQRIQLQVPAKSR